MAKVQKFDLTTEGLEIQEYAEKVSEILNNGSIEFETTAASSPAFAAPQETKLVLSIFGAQFRLYISFLGEWYYTTLTILP